VKKLGLTRNGLNAKEVIVWGREEDALRARRTSTPYATLPGHVEAPRTGGRPLRGVWRVAFAKMMPAWSCFFFSGGELG